MRAGRANFELGTYFLICLGNLLHEEDGHGIYLGQKGFAVMDQEVVHLFLASEPPLEVKNIYLRDGVRLRVL